MCNFDGFFRLIKEMSIAQNLYINVSIVLFSIILVLASLITMINFLSNNFSYKDMINLVDNMEFWELNMYIQSTDIAFLSYLDDYRACYFLFSVIERIYNKTDSYFIPDEIYDKFLKNVFIFDNDNNLTKNDFLLFTKNNQEIEKKLNLTNLYPIVYKRYNIQDFNSAFDYNKILKDNQDNQKREINLEKNKKILKHCFLFLNLLRKFKFTAFEIDDSIDKLKFIDKIFINMREANTYFYLTGSEEKFSFNPEVSKETIAEYFIEMAQNIFNSDIFIKKNQENLISNIVSNPLFIDNNKKIKELFYTKDYISNSNIPELTILFNKYNDSTKAELKNKYGDSKFDLINNQSNYNLLKKIHLKSIENIYFFSNLNILDLLANQVFVYSDYLVFPIFAIPDQNFNILNKKYCYFLHKFFIRDQLKNIDNLTNLKDCFTIYTNDTHSNNQIWVDFLSNSVDLLNLNSSTKFDFCELEDILDEEYNYHTSDYLNNTKINNKFCLNRFSLKKEILNPMYPEKSFKYKNSITPLLSYDDHYIENSLSNYYLSIFLKNEGNFRSFDTFQRNKILLFLFRGLYVFVSISIILVFYFVYNIIQVKEFIDQPLKKIESTLSHISTDKAKFKDSKKFLDEYLLEENSKTINEFKYLIKMILKLVEGNLNLKKIQVKNNELDNIYVNIEIQPINMVKFNRYIIFENKILESIDKNHYCQELTDKIGIEIGKDEKLKNSTIFSNFIQKKFLQEKYNKINQDSLVSSKYTEELFKTKYKILSFENFKCRKSEYKIDDVFNVDWVKVDEILSEFYFEVDEKYMENWYKDEEEKKVLFDCYEEIFND